MAPWTQLAAKQEDEKMPEKKQQIAKVPDDIEVVEEDKSPEEKAKEIERAWQHEHDRLKQEQADIKEAIGKATAAREQQRQDSPARSKINDEIKKLEEQKAEIEKKKDEATTALRLSKDAEAAFKPPAAEKEKEKENYQKALAAQIAAEAAEAAAEKELEAARNKALAAKAKAEAARNAAETAGAEEKRGRDGEDSESSGSRSPKNNETEEKDEAEIVLIGAKHLEAKVQRQKERLQQNERRIQKVDGEICRRSLTPEGLPPWKAEL